MILDLFVIDKNVGIQIWHVGWRLVSRTCCTNKLVILENIVIIRSLEKLYYAITPDFYFILLRHIYKLSVIYK